METRDKYRWAGFGFCLLVLILVVGDLLYQTTPAYKAWKKEYNLCVLYTLTKNSSNYIAIPNVTSGVNTINDSVYSTCHFRGIKWRLT